MSTTSPNMSLVVPTVGVDPFPTWANDINADLSILDQHNHSTGQGVPIQPNGININSDLPFNINNATLLRAARFSVQTIPIPNSGSDVGEIYVSGNELYYNDVSGGHQVQITTNGSVNAGAGSITGLPSGTASASYSAGTFTWQSATSTAANMDARSYVLRNSTANSKGLTLNPPLAMAADYSVTLPALPGSQSFMTVDTSGNMSGYASINQGISRTNLVAVGQQVSSSCGNFVTASSTPVDVTNLTVTITTTGRPVFIGLMDDGSGNQSYINGAAASGDSFTGANVYLVRGVSQIANPFLSASSSTANNPDIAAPVSSVWHLDVIGAGTYTYKIQLASTSVTHQAASINYAKLVAWEL